MHGFYILHIMKVNQESTRASIQETPDVPLFKYTRDTQGAISHMAEPQHDPSKMPHPLPTLKYKLHHTFSLTPSICVG